MELPNWVAKHKVKGTEVRVIKGKYYLYEITSKWNKEKKRAQKITKAFLGTITQQGLIPPKKRIEELPRPSANPSIKTYGGEALLLNLAQSFQEELAESFSKEANRLLATALLRILYQCPLKNLSLHYERSFLSELLPSCALSGASMTSFLREIGSQRDKIVAFMRKFVQGSEHILVDLTHMLSKSQKMCWNVPGYNIDKNFEDQLNLLYIYAVDQQSPVFYRLLPGNIRDITSFKLSIKEAGIKKAIVITDKGFFSKQTIENLEAVGLSYICPVKRNSSLIDSDFLKKADRKSFDGFFLFAKRPIWYFERTTHEGRRIITFLDPHLKTSEENDYLTRIANNVEGYAKEEFFEKQYFFGTVTFITNIPDASSEKIFTLYKGRCQIEQHFDTFKNMLHADRTYMQDERACEAWIFVNHLAMLLIAKIYNLLREKDLLKKYSPRDLLVHLSTIQKIKIDDSWVTSEIPKKTQTLMAKLDISIP